MYAWQLISAGRYDVRGVMLHLGPGSFLPGYSLGEYYQTQSQVPYGVQLPRQWNVRLVVTASSGHNE